MASTIISIIAPSQGRGLLRRRGRHLKIKATFRGAGESALAKILRLGETGENLVDAGIKVGAEQAAQLRAALEARLRARLDPRHYDLFLNPNQQLARALAEGLKNAARRNPLLIVLDTYEIVGRADIWLREVMSAAGPRIVWIVSGRDDLARSRRFGDEYFKGYAEEFPRRLVARDMLQLARDDVRAIFADRAPGRPLENDALEALTRATRGVPLAIHEAAEMWAKGNTLADIIGDIDEATPRAQIVPKMTARYFLHVPEADKPALYALALARGDVEILRAMLRPADEAAFDLESLLRRLEREYASVHYERCRLYDDAAFFLLEYLRTDERVRAMNRRAADALRARLEQLQADLPRLEDRCADDDWVKAALDLSDYLFWVDEAEAWHWLIPRLVEGLAYSRELRCGLVEIANRWRDHLSASGKKRAKALRATDDAEHSTEEWADLLDELTRLERLGYLRGEGEEERLAILAWQRGKLLYRRGKYTDALAEYERAERGLPAEGEALKKLFGEAFWVAARLEAV